MTIYCIYVLQHETKAISNVHVALSWRHWFRRYMEIVEKNFKISAFCNIIHPFVPPTHVCIVINCSKLLFTHFP